MFLIDIGHVSDTHSNQVLEQLHKSVELPHNHDKSIWTPHENPYIQKLVDEVHTRISARLSLIALKLREIIEGGKTPVQFSKALPYWMGPEMRNLQEAQAYLESLSPEDFTLEDKLLLVDWLVHRYLPPDVIESESEYMALRTVIAGKLQAAVGHRGLPVSTLLMLGTVLSTGTLDLRQEVLFKASESRVLEFAKLRAGQDITNVSDKLRRRFKRFLIRYEYQHKLGLPVTPATLSSDLFDHLAEFERDFRRIAVTESGRNANEGYLAAQPIGAKFRRVEAYGTACSFCSSIHGKVYTLVSPTKNPKNGDNEIWIGKDNVGRSASARKRVGGELIPREPHELWWTAAGVQHPHCRGTWAPVDDEKAPPGIDPKFIKWVDAQIARVG